MEVLMSGNVDVLSMMHLMATGADLDLSQVQNYEFQKKWKEAGDQAWRKATASNAPVEPSSFNYRVTAKEAILLYNTLYNAMAWVSPKEYRALCGQEKASPRQRKEFLEMGFVVPKDMDERENYGKWRKFLQQNRNYLSLNITTTLKCNAKCPYCYENGVKPVDFDESKLDALIEFIKKEEKGIPIKLNWFGGEPLLNPGLIDEVTRRVGECGFRFESYIVTNGSLITKKMLRKFKRWNVRSIQITLDGTEETYAAKKAYPASFRNPFRKVLDHIEWVADAGIHVDVRLNTDRENLRDMLDLVCLLQGRFDGNGNIVYYPAFVTGTDSKLTEREKIDFIKDIFVHLANPNKLSVTNRLYSTPRSSPCMRNDPCAFSVDVYGRVYHCEHLVGRPKESIGTLKRLSKKINEARAEESLREECQSCAFLPKCMGGCVSNLRTGDRACMIERYIIYAYMEYMCERAGNKIVEDEMDSSFQEQDVSPPMESTDAHFLSRQIHHRLKKLEETLTAQHETLRSLNEQMLHDSEARAEFLRNMQTVEELMRLDLANRLMDETEKMGKKKR